MKILIFCGGLATRFNNGKPGPLKPLIKIKNKSILEHVMNRYQKIKNSEFILLGGYRFNELQKFQKKISKKYRVIAINTGKYTNTAGRLLKVKKYIKKDFFFLTYGDTITDYNPKIQLKKNKKISMISLYKYNIPYGVLKKKRTKISNMYEKNFSIFVNAGHYYLDPVIFNYIKRNNQSFEKDILPSLIKKNILRFNYNVLKKWYPIDNKFDLDKVKSKI